MIAVLGAFGRTGRVVAEVLESKGRPVKLVTRNAARWAGEKADEIAVADLGSRDELARAFANAEAAYVILPDDPSAEAFHANRRAMADAIAHAIVHAEVPRIVLLSSVTAALGERGASGFGADLAYLERIVLDTPASVTVLRASYFQDNLASVLPLAKRDGIYPSFFPKPDVPIAMVAAADVGAIAARALLAPPNAHREVVDIVGPAYTSAEAAAALESAVGRPLAVVDVPEAKQEELFRHGMSTEAARAMVQTIACIGAGRAALQGERVERGAIPLERTLRAAVASAKVHA